MKVASILCLVFVIGGVSAVQLNKPLPNVLAIVGRRFAYSIPKDTRREVQYKVFEEGQASLPKWLSYDPAQNILQGVPVARDRRVYRMTVLGVETVVFTLEVRDLEMISNKDIIYGTNHTKVQNLRPQKCTDGKPLSAATIVFDLNIKTLSGEARMDLIKKASSFGDLPVDQFYMRSGRGYETALPLNEVMVLTAGPGNVRDPKEQGVAVSWLIGCGMDTELEGTRVASKFKSSAETNSFHELFGAPVSGWHLATGFPKKPKSKKRVRRQAVLRGSTQYVTTATPVATVRVPVSREESRTVVISPTAVLVPVSSTLAIPLKPPLEETTATTSVSLSAIMSSTVVAPLTTVVSSVVSTPAIPVTQETYVKTTVAAESSPESSTVPAVTSPTATSAPLLIQSTSVVQPPADISSTVVLPEQPTSVVQPPADISSTVALPEQPTSVIQPQAEMSSTVVLPERPTSSSPVLTDTKTSAVEEVAPSVMVMPATSPAMAAKVTTQEQQMTTELIRTTTLATQTQFVLIPTVTTTQSSRATSILMPPTTPKEPVVSTEEKPTTTTTEPDTQPPIWLNFRPKLKKRISRITLLVGQNLLYRIPEDSFYDKEDGNTRNLRLQLQTIQGKPVSANSWIQLREDKQEIYGLPMDVSFRLYHYKLVATDSGNKSIADEFEVTVQEAPSRSNHQFTIQMLLDHFSFMKNTSLHTLLLEKIAGYFGVNVTNIRVVGFASGSVLFTFRFDFVQYEPCNHDEMLELISKFQDSNGAVSENLRRSLLPEFPVESGSFSLSGPCSDVVDASKTKDKGESEDDRAWWIYAIIPAVALVALIIITCVVVIRHRRKKKKYLTQDRSAYLHLYQKTPTVMQDEYELNEHGPLV